MRCSLYTGVMGLAFAAAVVAPLQDAAAQPAANGACGAAAELGKVAVTDAWRAGANVSAPKDEARIVWLRSGIEVKVRNLKTLIAYAACTVPNRKIVLFLDGRPLPNLSPYPPTSPESDMLNFVLKRDESSREVWTHVLGHPTSLLTDATVSVGVVDEPPVQSEVKVRFQIADLKWLFFSGAVLLGIVGMFLRLATRSDIIRDRGTFGAGGLVKPYSLARTQAAFWFLLTLVSYVFIGIVTGDYQSTITGTVLALTGMSAATAVGSSLVDVDQAATRQAKVQAAVPGQAVQPGVAAAPPAGAAAAGVPPSPATAAAAAPPVSQGFLNDILSDGNGVNFHRFQMFGWTLILGTIFVHEMWANLAMPEFSGTLLGLLGISSGTYLGLKVVSEG